MQWANFFHIYQPPQWPRAIIAKVVRESYLPLTRFLLAHRKIRITLNVSGSLTEQLADLHFHDVLRRIRALLERGQVELTNSAMYHAILPLLPEKEIIRQIKLNHATNHKYFGRHYRPVGFFPPEMAYSPKLGHILYALGYRWMVLDGLSHPGVVNYSIRYRVRGSNLWTVFRNRFVSDYLAFSVQPDDEKHFLSTVQRWNNQTDILITAMDGENLGHHRRITKHLWQRLVSLRDVETVTYSDLLKSLASERIVTPRAASWSSRHSEIIKGIPFALWKNPKNRLHRLQWQLFSLVLDLIHAREQRDHLPASIRTEFDRAVASDWYWWASREPWWDVGIVVAAAEHLLTIAEELDPSHDALDRVRSLVGSIAATARTWQETGAPQRHAARFLQSETTPRYLGGERVR